jgi:hypothetical protein
MPDAAPLPSRRLMSQQTVCATPGAPPIWEVEHLAIRTVHEGKDTEGLTVTVRGSAMIILIVEQLEQGKQYFPALNLSKLNG